MITPTSPVAPTLAGPSSQALMNKAKELEAGFLSEMLSYAGLGETLSSLFGTAGEDRFASFLRDAQAKEMVAAGGIGLAQSLFQALVGAEARPAQGAQDAAG